MHEKLCLRPVIRCEHQEVLGRDKPRELLPPKGAAYRLDGCAHLDLGDARLGLDLGGTQCELRRLLRLGRLERRRLALRVIVARVRGSALINLEADECRRPRERLLVSLEEETCACDECQAWGLKCGQTGVA